MKRFGLFLLTVSLLAGGTVWAAGAAKGKWELGPYVGAGFPDDYNPTDMDDTNLILGGRLGHFVTECLSLEGSFHRQFAEAAGGADVNMDAIRLNALYNFRPEQTFRPFVTVGGGMERVGGGIDQWDAAPNGGLGAKWMISEHGGLRLDGRYIPVKVKGNGVNGWQHNFEGVASWFMLFGKKAEKPAPVVAAAPTAAPLPGDADGDGVNDDDDRCPNTPAGATVDSSGCPMDSDNDGVLDGLDKCPGTPASTKIDSYGCPLVSKARGALKGVTFKTGSAVLTEPSKKVLDEVAATLNEFSGVRAEVQGHTDNRGNPANNQKLSQARAEAVMKYLSDQGVATDRLTSKGYGDAKPVADNATAAGRQQNRRVELNWLE